RHNKELLTFPTRRSSDLVNEEKLHPNYINIYRDPHLRKTLSNWAIGFQDRDNKFVKEFQTTFNSSFWELYLHACFNNLGFEIDYSYSSPDVVVKTRRRNLEMAIEAVGTRHAEGGLPEHERISVLNEWLNKNINYTTKHEEIVHLATERIANSINNKAIKYQKSYSKLDHVKGLPFMLAIGG